MNNNSILAIYNVNLKTRGHLGVMRKMLAQSEGFSLNGKQVHLICGDGSDIVRIIYDNGNEIDREIITSAVIPGDFFIHAYNWICNNIELASSFNWSYIRFNPMNNDELIKLSRKLNQLKVLVFIEMYTLEYQNELSDDGAVVDEFYLKQLSKYITAFFTPSSVTNKIFYGKPLIKSANGVSSIRSNFNKQNISLDKEFNLIGIGYLAKWHGYDRILPSVKQFNIKYPYVKLNIYLVGQGPASETLREDVKKYEIESDVIFTGALDAESINSLYQIVHVGLGNLGFHRTGVSYAEALKHREFMHHKIPFIYSVNDSFTHEKLLGAIKVAPDESVVQVSDLYEWYLKNDVNKLSDKLGQYSDENFSWQSITKYIINKVESYL